MWVLFILGIHVSGAVQGMVLDQFADREECMVKAREVNAIPNAEAWKWTNAGCLQIPNPKEQKPAKWADA